MASSGKTKRPRARRQPESGTRQTPSNGLSGASSAPSSEPKDYPVVGVGASAGGLNACQRLLRATPSGHGVTYILIQHLDPTHKSFMVELLARNTTMVVRQAEDGMPIEPDHLYIIPPGTYLSVGDGVLRLSQPQERHGARMPFDFLLRSLAAAYGDRAACVILSGSGSDGAIGLKTIKEQGGFVIAQDPDEAGYDGMPRSAIETGTVDHICSVAEIPGALIDHQNDRIENGTQTNYTAPATTPSWLPKIIDLLRLNTVHDFSLYKPGTLKRRIERRIGLVGKSARDMDQYIEILGDDENEREALAKDLLINVTSFFRDPKVYDSLAERILPDLIANHPVDRAIRIWVPGCSTGEETYSLAMLLYERIAASGRNIKLQIFASDVDPDAVATARDGLYPDSIETEISPDRLNRFFTKEDTGYRASSELRNSIVFVVHDVLADPPFSRLDLISCRNLLIYLLPEAQSKVISLFHFALRSSGLLLLGNSETVGKPGDRFEIVSKSDHLYRQTGRQRHGDLGFTMNGGEGVRIPKRRDMEHASPRPINYADLCRRLVTEAYAPATVLINRKQECLYFMGPIDAYLKVAPGHPANDLLSLVRDEVRTKLRTALQRVVQENAPAVVPDGRISNNGVELSFSITARPILSDKEELILISFVEDAKRGARQPAATTEDIPLVGELELELQATRMELQGAIRNLEISNEEQKVFYEEALSVNEEFQSTNEELLASKEELQSLNEELTALNSQLLETLDRQRTTSDDLQNILYSTDVATLFLDPNLNIRFFTPATKFIFNVIPGDIGRPLADLSSLAVDSDLIPDAHTVLREFNPIERVILAQNGAWYIRRVLPYRAQGGNVEGVVITFVDDTERRHIADALATAEQSAQLANVAKSRFLAAASHDLRQPLQTLVLLQGLLMQSIKGEKAKTLAHKIDNTLGVMTGMLDTLLDIHQIETGIVHPEISDFPIGNLLERLHDEFIYPARDKNIALRLVKSHEMVRSDPRMIEQIIRNLLSNALKYTQQGEVLLGCRRHGAMLSIEVWDTGIGIPQDEHKAIFEEYHQLDNAARERERGLGLGLSIVQRLATMLNHRIGVRSHPGKGSAFSIDVPRHENGSDLIAEPRQILAQREPIPNILRTGAILVVEDDPEVCQTLAFFLDTEGHRVTTASDGLTALELAMHKTLQPDLIIADYNLPNNMNGIQFVAELRGNLRRQIPALLLSGDTSPELRRHAEMNNCIQLNKPVRLADLSGFIQTLLARSLPLKVAQPRPIDVPRQKHIALVHVVDDDNDVRAAICAVLQSAEIAVMDYPDGETFLATYHPGENECLLIDAVLPGISGLDVLQRLKDMNYRLPSIMLTGNGDISMAVEAMKAGIVDFIEKPIGRTELIVSIEQALKYSDHSERSPLPDDPISHHLAGLTKRQSEILDLVLAGHPSKNIAVDLGISRRTVENHRAAIMKKTGSKSLPALVRAALTSSAGDTDDSAG